MDPWPDTVYSWIEGDGAGFGKGHFPDNVLGPPDSNARPCIPSARPDEILTLGTGGVIILGFTDNRIIDGIGPDFVVFENSFYVLCDSENVFAETGIISVSQDCVNFVQFSYNASTWEGLAGVTPTTGEDYMNPDSSGGDAFDLANVGLPWAICVRIQDADTLVDDSGPHFDLDAVVAVHSAPPLGIEENHNQSNPLNQLIRLEQNFPNPFRFETVIHYSIPQGGKFVIYNLMGQKVYSMSLSPESHVLRYRGGDLPGGSYLYEIQSKDTRVARKMLIVR